MLAHLGNAEEGAGTPFHPSLEPQEITVPTPNLGTTFIWLEGSSQFPQRERKKEREGEREKEREMLLTQRNSSAAQRVPCPWSTGRGGSRMEWSGASFFSLSSQSPLIGRGQLSICPKY